MRHTVQDRTPAQRCLLAVHTRMALSWVVLGRIHKRQVLHRGLWEDVGLCSKVRSQGEHRDHRHKLRDGDEEVHVQF